jgi:hypothetical protein
VSRSLEETELFAGRSEDLVFLDLEDIEANSFRKRTTLASSDDVSVFDFEGRRAVDGSVGVALFETVVLLDVMQIVTTNHNGASHLGRDHHTFNNTTTDRNVASERTLLINIFTFNSLLRSCEAKTYILVPSQTRLLTNHTLRSKEHCGLLLESPLILLHFSYRSNRKLPLVSFLHRYSLFRC